MEQIQHMYTHLYWVCLSDWFTKGLGKKELGNLSLSCIMSDIAVFCIDLRDAFI